MITKRVGILVALIGCVWGTLTAGMEYYVSPLGQDGNDGLSPATAIGSLQEGVDRLSAGDTLTILPGEYHGGFEREGLGGKDVETTIRALVPGTVIIRGDTPAPDFEEEADHRFASSVVLVGDIERIINRNTGQTLRGRVHPAELEFSPGGYYHDHETGKLVVTNPDLTSGAGQSYSVVTNNVRAGIFLIGAQRVVLEGLVITGFYNSEPLERIRGVHQAASRNTWAVFLLNSTGCVIRNCTAYLNSGGIMVHSSDNSGGNVIEGCRAWNSGANIAVIDGNEDLIRNCVAFLGSYGIRHYGGRRPARQEGNLAWGNSVLDFQLKGIEYDKSWAVRNIALGNGKSKMLENSLIVGWNRNSHPDETEAGTIRFLREENLDPEMEFADVWNFDFRLQGNSRFRGAGVAGGDAGPAGFQDDVFYLSPEGDDLANGLSIGTAWRTLGHALQSIKSGGTLYIEPGNWSEKVAIKGKKKAISVRGRGKSPVLIEGAISLESDGDIEIDNLLFSQPVKLGSNARVEITNSAFAGNPVGLTVESAASLHLENCEFPAIGNAGVVIGEVAEVFIAGSLFDNKNGVGIELKRPVQNIFSDYNIFSRKTAAWSHQQHAGPPSAFGTPAEQHSRQHPVILISDGGFPRPDSSSLPGNGFLGRGYGIHRDFDFVFAANEFVPQSEPLMVAELSLLSATSTTANVEWWADAPAEYELRWWPRENPGDVRTIDIEAHRFVSFSLSDLEPATEYVLSISAATASIGQKDVSDADWHESIEFNFATTTDTHRPRDLFVSHDGDDTADGLSRTSAWRSLNHAAARLLPGDTLWIAGGQYSEPLWVRATGSADAPIAFRAVPGERVQFNGMNRRIGAVVTSTNKKNLIFDGFYIRDISTGSPTPFAETRHSGAFVLYRSDDVVIERCFMDGRDPGYSPGLVMATHCQDLTIRNCVVIGAMGGAVTFAACPNTTIENNVFLRSMIANVGEGMNRPEQPIIFRNNILTDSIPSKQNTSLANFGQIESLTHDNNCYFLRDPQTKVILTFYHPEGFERAARVYRMNPHLESPAFSELTRMTLHEYQQWIDTDDSSFTADPGFAIARQIPETDSRGRTLFIPDELMRYDTLDFRDLFATNPKLIEKGIGLQPDAFETGNSHD